MKSGFRPDLYTSDSETLKTAFSIARSAAERQHPFLIAGILFLCNFMIGCVAFMVKPIVRYNLGLRSFGLVMFVVTLMLLRSFGVFDYRVGHKNTLENLIVLKNERISRLTRALNSPDLELSNNERDSLKELITFDNESKAGWAEELKAVPPFTFNEYLNLLTNPDTYTSAFTPKEGFRTTDVMKWYIIFFVIAFSIHSSFAQNRWEKRKRWHSYHRGKSIFLSWLSKDKTDLQSEFALRLGEAVLLVFIALAVLSHIDSALTLIVLIGTIAMFVEDYLHYQTKKKMVLDIIDSELDAEMLIAEKAKFVSESYSGNNASEDRKNTGYATLP
jgi:hypothetical protein